jgi:tetratricopeptide (TPR) repeat protein
MRMKGESEPFSGDFIEKDEKGATIGTGTFLNGVIDGARTAFYPNGEKSLERIYVEGYANGVGTDYYENGKTKLTGVFKDGEETGKWTFYFDTGEVRVVFHYKEGVQHGEYLEYSKDGTLLKKRYAREEQSGYSDAFNELYYKAEELRVQFKVKEAIELYDKALEINPTMAKAFFGRGECKGYSDFEEAIKDYDKAIEFDKDNMLAYRNRGNARFNVYSSKGILTPPAEELERACNDLHKAKELGDTSELSEGLIDMYCKKSKKKKKKKK